MEEENEGGFIGDEYIEDAELTYLQEMAFIIHEMYEAYLEAGFSNAQALWLAAVGQADLSTPDS